MRRPPRPSTCTIRIAVAALAMRCAYYRLYWPIYTLENLLQIFEECKKEQVNRGKQRITYRLTLKIIPSTVVLSW